MGTFRPALFAALWIAACASDPPLPPAAPPVVRCPAGGLPCPAAPGRVVACEDGVCVARSPNGGDPRADCNRLGGYGVLIDQDERNCGACGRWCPDGSRCVDGACDGCAPGLTGCSTGGADLRVSQRHCGACEHACPARARCADGRCVPCAAGQIRCGGACVDPQREPAHCGACGVACGAGDACREGRCVRECPAGFTSCFEVCVDLQSSNDQCGVCGRACDGGRSCVAGACVCPPALSSCGPGSCVDLRFDALHCGTCGNRCSGLHACRDGVCQLACSLAGLGTCGDTCVDFDADGDTDTVDVRCHPFSADPPATLSDGSGVRQRVLPCRSVMLPRDDRGYRARVLDDDDDGYDDLIVESLSGGARVLVPEETVIYRGSPLGLSAENCGLYPRRP